LAFVSSKQLENFTGTLSKSFIRKMFKPYREIHASLINESPIISRMPSLEERFDILGPERAEKHLKSFPWKALRALPLNFELNPQELKKRLAYIFGKVQPDYRRWRDLQKIPVDRVNAYAPFLTGKQIALFTEVQFQALEKEILFTKPPEDVFLGECVKDIEEEFPHFIKLFQDFPIATLIEWESTGKLDECGMMLAFVSSKQLEGFTGTLSKSFIRKMFKTYKASDRLASYKKGCISYNIPSLEKRFETLGLEHAQKCIVSFPKEFLAAIGRKNHTDAIRMIPPAEVNKVAPFLTGDQIAKFTPAQFKLLQFDSLEKVQLKKMLDEVDDRISFFRGIGAGEINAIFKKLGTFTSERRILRDIPREFKGKINEGNLTAKQIDWLPWTK